MPFELSLKTIGSPKLHEKVLDDVETLIKEAKKQNLRPFMLIVGPLFIEVGAAQALIQELDIKDWDRAVEDFRAIMNELIMDKRLSISKMCEKKNGMFSKDTITGMEVFFNPDETYISVKCADPATKAQPGESATKDGYLVITMKHSKNKILTDFITDSIH